MIALDPNVLDREALIAGYRYLCGRAARKFVRNANDRGDLEQVAAIGLIKAADRFDAGQGVPFEAYAWTLILGELMHYVRDCERPVRVPRRIRELDRRWSNAERELWIELNREPRDGEIAGRLGLSKRDQQEIVRYRAYGAVVSTEGLHVAEQRALSYTIDEQLDRLTIEAGMAVLSETERTVLRDIYEHDTPIGIVAQKLGYSRRHIARLRKAALKKLAPLARGLTAR